MLNTLAVENITIGKHTNVPNLGKVNLIVGKDERTKIDLLNVIHKFIPDTMSWCWINNVNDHFYAERKINRFARCAASATDGVMLLDRLGDSIHHSMMDDVWQTLFDAAQRNNVQIFATTNSRDCVEGFSKAASAHKDIGGVLFRLGKSAKASNKGEIIATRFDADELRDVIAAGIEVR